MSARQINVALLISCLLGIECSPAPSVPHEDSSLGIVGGDTVNITDVPYMARYRSKERTRFCGAAIIHPRFLVTSATCRNIMEAYGSHTYVTVGTDKAYSEAEDYHIADSYAHPLHGVFSMIRFDVAVLILYKEMTFNEKVQAIPLAKEDFKLPEGSTLDALGFGVLNEDKQLAKYLQKVSIPHVPFEKCKELYPRTRISPFVICAGADGKGSCVLDNGGPLVYKNTLVGVNTWLLGCGNKGRPSVYTSISTVRDFIDDVMDS